MAASLYLLLMWGYVELNVPQLFAVFAALIMCIALLFWVNEARAVNQLSGSLEIQGKEDWLPLAPEARRDVDIDLHSYAGSVSRLDALRDDLAAQYAQLGRDQSATNLKGLGAWHRPSSDGKNARQ